MTWAAHSARSSLSSWSVCWLFSRNDMTSVRASTRKPTRPGSGTCWSRNTGALTLTLILLALPGCQSLRGLTGSSASSRALPPIKNLLTVQPIEMACQMASGKVETCMVMKKSDWERAIIELKSACFALGGLAADCDPPVTP